MQIQIEREENGYNINATAEDGTTHDRVAESIQDLKDQLGEIIDAVYPDAAPETTGTATETGTDPNSAAVQDGNQGPADAQP